MILPNAARAIVEIEKLRDYCLSESHPRGKHKARVFATALGLTVTDVFELRDAIYPQFKRKKQLQANVMNMVNVILWIFP